MVETANIPEIIPVLSKPSRCEGFRQCVLDIQQALKKVIPSGGGDFTFEQLRCSLPLVKWEECHSVPGALSITLLCPSRDSVAISNFFSEMVGRWLIPGKQQLILSSRNMSFRFSEWGSDTYFFADLSVQVEREKDLVTIRETLPLLVKEISLGVASGDFARYILEAKGLSKEQKMTMIHHNVVSLMQRFPKDIEEDIFVAVQHFLLLCDDGFKKIRDVSHMCRIICSQYLFRKALLRDVDAFPKQRHLRFKLLRTRLSFPFGSKKVLGIVIGVNLERDYELLEERHILKAIQRFIPGVMAVQRSFFSFQQKGGTIRSLYLEVEKENRTNFTLEEMWQLNKGLAHELKVGVEQLSRSVFMLRNEEEVFRNIMILSRELKYVRDVPQVIISFHEQTELSLIFHVVLLRILRRNTPSIQELFALAKTHVTYIPNQTKIVGHIRRKYAKEANVFSLQFDKEEFLRKDHSVDFYKAREFVVSILEHILGEVRDYNGGLILKQNQLLVSVKSVLDENEGQYEFLLENFFYSLSPAVMQSVLQPTQIKMMFLLFLNLLNHDLLKKEGYLLKKERHQDYAILMIRAEDSSFVKEVQKVLEGLSIDELELGSTFVNVYGSSYLGYLYRCIHRDKSHAVFSVIEQAMSLWAQKKRSLQRLRISLSQATPSLDPRIGTDHSSGMVIKMLYECLMRVGKNGKPEPAAAQHVEVSPDLKTYSFHLRDNVWSDGSPLTARDFEYAWKKILDPNFKTLYAYLFHPIKNAKAVKEGNKPLDELGVHAVDEKTLVVELEYPAPYFLELTSHWTYSPLCHDIDKIYPGWSYYGGEAYICNGPFKLAQWKRNQGLQLVRNPLYWDTNSVKLQSIDISIVEDSQTMLTMFEQDELDWVGEPLAVLPSQAIMRYQKENRIYQHPIAGIYWLEYNIEHFPFNSSKIRKAFAYAIHRQGLIDHVLQGHEKPATSVIPPSMALQEEPYFKDGDVQKARQLFVEGLAELGIDRRDFPPITLSYSLKEGEQALAEVFKQQWEEALGVEVHMEGFSWDVYFDKVTKHDFQVGGVTWSSWFHDPIYNLEYLKYKSNKLNSTQWEHPEYIRLLDAAQSTLDMAKRRHYLHEAEKLLLEEMPICPIFTYCDKYMKKKNLKGVYLSPLGHVDFKWAYFEKIKKK